MSSSKMAANQDGLSQLLCSYGSDESQGSSSENEAVEEEDCIKGLKITKWKIGNAKDMER